MRTEDLIVDLARSARPVRPLPSPLQRFATWAAATAALMIIAVFAIGPRSDVQSAVSQSTFLSIAALTLGTALLAAASAFLLSVPGTARQAWQLLAPLVAGGAWAFALAYFLASEGAAIDRLRQWPIHITCLIEIMGLGVPPAWVLFRMLRAAAPLRIAWAGALATLAAAAFAAAATQFLCPIDDEAHHLVGHVLPVALLSIAGAIAGHRFLNWMAR